MRLQIKYRLSRIKIFALSKPIAVYYPMSPEKLTNRQIAGVFQNIADLLEIKGEVIYKILAYRRAAESLSEVGRDINDIWQEGKLLEIPGVGKAIAEKIDELLSTGRLGFYDKLTAEVPVTLVELLQVPDLGPKKVGLFWHELGVTDLKGLEAAARSGKLRGLPGMGEKSEAKVIAGIESLSRRSDRLPLGRAWPFAQEMVAFLRAQPGVTAVEVAGSLRRMRPTVGDIDLLVAVADSEPVIQAFVTRPGCGAHPGAGERQSQRRVHLRAARPIVGAPAGALRHRLAVRHRLERPQRAPARAGSQAGSLALGAFPGAQRWQRDPVRPRRRGLRRPGAALDPARAARGPRRGAGGARRAASPA